MIRLRQVGFGLTVMLLSVAIGIVSSYAGRGIVLTSCRYSADGGAYAFAQGNWTGEPPFGLYYVDQNHYAKIFTYAPGAKWYFGQFYRGGQQAWTNSGEFTAAGQYRDAHTHRANVYRIETKSNNGFGVVGEAFVWLNGQTPSNPCNIQSPIP